jgi:hypothetical protein
MHPSVSMMQEICRPPLFVLQRIGIVPGLAPEGPVSGVYAKKNSAQLASGIPSQAETDPTPRADQELPSSFQLCCLGQKRQRPDTRPLCFVPPDTNFCSSTLNTLLLSPLPPSPLPHAPALNPHPSLPPPTMGTVTTTSTMASSLDAASLFRVDGMVAVVTGGGSGILHPPLSIPSRNH